MFAIPGICALIMFILARPQEFLVLLQRVPFLHLFTALAAVGWVIDIRLRRLQPMATPGLPWAAAFLFWGVACVGIVVPDIMLGKAVEQTILFVLYATIAHGIQRWRAFQVVAGVMVATCMFITLVCFHQGLAPMECIGGEDIDGEIHGASDGRECSNNEMCTGPDAEPGLEYRCEHVGLFGTYSVEGRIRYRGGLQDPNEVALSIAAGAMSLLVAFMRRKSSPLFLLLAGIGVAIVAATIMQSQSRGGMVGMMLVLGVYVVRRYGFWTLIPAGIVAMTVMSVGGRSGANADMSTQQRYEAWAAGLDMFRASPIYGVGVNQFVEHHYLTAHNAFVLALGESGFPGLVLFVSMVYITIKSLIVGLSTIRKVPGSEAAQVWGLALLASMFGILFQINTLSFTYHPVLWIFFGLVGAWTNCIRTYHPLDVKIRWKDFIGIVIACVFYVFVLLPLLLKAKGEA